ncbi:MAG TPA: alpha/beta hydrolase [Candidatus Binataceae bacterium]|nr:alpha/beta hydrolase [Candidatus Binataceae bacterium]
MPTFKRNDVSLYYEEFGSGFPILLFAPGGMRSSIDFWHKSPFDPTVEFASDFRVIAMDQRNAGKSIAPISANDGWHTYTEDHLALLDHLGIDQCHVMGGCIGGSYDLSIMKAAPARIASAVLQQPIGLSPNNRELFFQMFDGWGKALKDARPEIDAAAFKPFRDRMYGGDFVFCVTRDFVKSCKIPMLVLCGNDDYHPLETSTDIAKLAPNAEIIMNWKAPNDVRDTVARVREFLRANTPAKS